MSRVGGYRSTPEGRAVASIHHFFRVLRDLERAVAKQHSPPRAAPPRRAATPALASLGAGDPRMRLASHPGIFGDGGDA